MIKNCKQCLKNYETTQKVSIYCSNVCQAKKTQDEYIKNGFQVKYQD